MFYCGGYLHLEFLIHVPPQLVPKEEDDEPAGAKEESEEDEVEETADYGGEDGGGFCDCPATALLFHAELATDYVSELVLVAELDLLVIEDDCGVVSDLVVLGAVQGQSLVDLEVLVVALLLAGTQEGVDLTVNADVDVQVVHYARRAVLGVETFGVPLETFAEELLHVFQVLLTTLLEN